MSSIEAPELSETKPMPPRYWWLKRILATAGVLSIVVVCGHWLWGVAAERNLQKKIAQLRAAGQPVLPEDFEQPAVPDEENAAYYIEQACSALVLPTKPGEMYVDDITDNPIVLIRYPDVAARALARNKAALLLLVRADQTRVCNWRSLSGAPVRGGIPLQWSGTRKLARLACAAAYSAHQQGSDAATIEALHQALRVGECTGQAGGLMGALVRGATDGLAARVVEYVAPELRVAPGRSGNADSGGAPRGRVRNLIARLMDDQAASEAWRYAMQTERADALQKARLLCDGTTPVSSWSGNPPVPLLDSLARIVLYPRWRIQTATMLDEFASVSNWPEAQQRLGLTLNWGFQWPLDPVKTALHPFDTSIYGRAFAGHLGSVAKKRMAATVLAIRLYELDHDRRPETLEELVPDYLTHLPIDPFAAGGRPLGYLPHADVPVVYSVGRDGVDDRGQDVLDSAGNRDSDRSDRSFRLDRRDFQHHPSLFEPAASQPTSDESVDQKPDVENEGGEPDER